MLPKLECTGCQTHLSSVGLGMISRLKPHPAVSSKQQKRERNKVHMQCEGNTELDLLIISLLNVQYAFYP
jgi:hypothetical protein